jgi:hypothetical protein
MAFELKPFEPEEGGLFRQMPLELEDVRFAFGAVGRVRAELEWHSFNYMWCLENDQLFTQGFRHEMNSLLHELRCRHGVFDSAEALSGVLVHAQSFENGDKGFKIQTASYSYYFRCREAERSGYDITIYAYDNARLLPELAGKHELPEKCYTVLEGRLVLLR